MIGHDNIAKATKGDSSPDSRRPSRRMERFFNSVKKKLASSSLESQDSGQESRQLRRNYARNGTGGSVRLSEFGSQLSRDSSMPTSPRPETDEELYAQYKEVMMNLGVNVDIVPALKNKSPDEMWMLVCSAEVQGRDDKHGPEYFAERLENPAVDVNFLKSLRIALSSKPLAWNEDFANCGGWEAILGLFERLQKNKKLESKLPMLRELMKIVRAFTNNKVGVDFAFGSAEMAKKSLLALAGVFTAPCRQVRHCAVQILLLAALINESKLVPLIIESFESESQHSDTRPFGDFSTALSEALNCTASVKDTEGYQYILDSILLVNSLIQYGIEKDDLEFRMNLRSLIFDTELRRAFRRYKVIDDDVLTGHCETYISRTQADADLFMARFHKTGKDLQDPAALIQSIHQVTEEDDVIKEALNGLLIKLLTVSAKSCTRMKYLAAVDKLVEEIIQRANGHAIDFQNGTKEDMNSRVELLTLRKTVESLENKLAHSKVRIDNLTAQQTELEAQIDAKGQRLACLAKEKQNAMNLLEQQIKKKDDEISDLKAEIFSLKKHQETHVVIGKLSLDSPTNETTSPVSPPPPISLAAPPLPAGLNVPPPSPLSIGLNAPPPPPLPTGMNCPPPPPPPPMPTGLSCPPPPPPLPMGFNAPPPPPLPFGMNAPPPPPMPLSPGMPPPPPPMPLSPGMPAPPMQVAPRIRPKPNGKTRQLQWEKMTIVKGTIWEEVDEREWEDEIDFKELEHTFRYEVYKAAPTERRSSQTSAVSLFDPKKARNLQIILGGTRLSPVELRTSLLKMDEKVWSESVVHEIIKYLPTASETEEICKFFEDPENVSSTVVSAERIVYELSKIQGLEERLKSIELKAIIGDWHVGALERLNALTKAMDELFTSGTLKSFLALVLVSGNFLNSGSYKANANGFKIDSLLKIRDMKATEGRSNLLTYLLTFLHQKHPDLLKLPDEIKDTQQAEKVSLEAMNELLGEKKRTLSKLEKLATDYKERNIEDFNGGFDRYLKVIPQFIDEAKGAIEKVESTLSATTARFGEILEYFGDDGQLKCPESFFAIFSNFGHDFEVIKTEIIQASSEAHDLKQKVLLAQDGTGRDLLDNILSAARKTC